MERCEACGADVDAGCACTGCGHVAATPLLVFDATGDSGPGTPDPAGAERPGRRPQWPVVVLAVAVGVLALGGIWSAGGDEPDPAPDEPGSVRPPATADDGASSAGTGLGGGFQGSFVPFSADTVAVSVSEAGSVAADLPAEIAGLRIAVRAGAEVLVIDLGDATVRSVDSVYGDSLLNAGGFVLTAHAVVVVDDGVGRLVALEGPVGATVDLGDAVDAVGVPGDDRVWLIDAPDSPPGFASAREVVAAGEAGAYRAAEVGFGSRTFASRAVPAGLVVVNVLAGTWIHDGVDWRSVYDGKPLASFEDIAVVQECSSADSCGAFRVDLSTGERVVASQVMVDLAAEGADLVLEPAGTSAVFRDVGGGIGRVDVVSGGTGLLSSWGGPGSRLLGLSPGGRWLFASDGVDEVVAFDLTGGVKGAVVVMEGLDPSVDLATFQVVAVRG
ncbi:MAG: hypothetical protein RIE08_07535 [Acidimicrobiales bacterium]